MPGLPEEAQPGDLIGFTYRGYPHWAVYVGDGYVVHLVPKASQDTSWGEYLSNLWRWCSRAVVKRELLQAVVGNGHYRVNNFWDSHCSRRSQNKIVSSVMKMVGKEMEYKDLSRKSERFVTFLRYGLMCKEQVCELPKPGDLIEIFNDGYRHWAIYEGHGYVVHLAPQRSRRWFSLSRRENVTVVVHRELWEALIRDFLYRINNHLDGKCPPLPESRVLSVVKKKIGMKMTMDFSAWKTKCEAFVTYLRYGLISSELFCDGPKPGDMIEFFRKGYQHWAIYEGDGYVVHLAPPDDFLGKEHMIYSLTSGMAVVKRQLLKDVVQGCPYRVNNYVDEWQSPRLQKEILRDASRAVGKEMDYSLLHWNCEHFTTCLRNEKPYSAQADKFLQSLRNEKVKEVLGTVGPSCGEVVLNP